MVLISERILTAGGFDHSQHDPREDTVQYFGCIINPTVHIGLNQLRRLVNLIIAVHRRPDEIVGELARDDPYLCPCTGKRISAGMLSDGSCDVDHITAYLRTLRLMGANRQKVNKTPWKA